MDNSHITIEDLEEILRVSEGVQSELKLQMEQAKSMRAHYGNVYVQKKEEYVRQVKLYESLQLLLEQKKKK